MEAAGATAGSRTRGRQLIVGALCLATFWVTGSGTAITPFLLDMARDLQADLAAVANLVSASSVTWGATSLVAGAASDRLGRKPILLAGLLIVVLSVVGTAVSESYGWVAAWRLIGGMGGGAFMGTVFATVSDQFPSAERGRALGWIITGQSLSLVMGVPLLTFIGAFGGWRGALAAQGLATLAAMLALWVVVPRVRARRTERPVPVRSVVKLLGPKVLALLGAGTMERVCYACVVVFLPTYLLATYGVSLQSLAIGLALVSLGNLAGNFLGGHLTDRVPNRAFLFAASLAVTAVLALPLLLWQPGVELSIIFGFAYTVVNAIGRPAVLAAVSEVSSEARGALMGLNVTFSSFGWLGASALGGWLITGSGFGALGLLAAATGLAGAILATLSGLGRKT